MAELLEVCFGIFMIGFGLLAFFYFGVAFCKRIKGYMDKDAEYDRAGKDAIEIQNAVLKYTMFQSVDEINSTENENICE